MSDLDVLRANLKRVRVQRGWSQEFAAHQSGIAMSHFAKIERGERDPRSTTIIKLMRGLDMPPAALFCGVDGLPQGDDVSRPFSDAASGPDPKQTRDE